MSSSNESILYIWMRSPPVEKTMLLAADMEMPMMRPRRFMLLVWSLGNLSSNSGDDSASIVGDDMIEGGGFDSLQGFISTESLSFNW